jgi:glycosidase
VRRSGSAFAVALAGIALFAGLAATDAVGKKRAPRPPAPPSAVQVAQLSQPPVRTSLASQRIYFVMTDRYADGDPSNDTGHLGGDRDTNGFDPTDIGYFHGGDLKGLTGACTSGSGLARIKALGFTALWVTPPVVNKAVQGDSAGYHGYWGLDFLNVDPHLGTNADFAAFVDCAHRLGMKVYQDIVVNHTADVIQGPDSFIDPSTTPYRNCSGRKFNPAKYVTRKFPCMKASNMPAVPVVPPDERNAKSPAWLNDVTHYHNRGSIDFSSCSDLCYQQGDIFSLDDLFTEQPVVMQGLADVYADWMRRYKIDGFRIDTARHLNPAFFKLWVPRILAAAQAAGVSDFQMFGEVPITDDVELSRFVWSRGLPNVLDFPFQDDAAGLAAGATSSGALADRLLDDDYFRYAPNVAPTPPTFLGNHDMGRAALQVLQKGPGNAGTLLERVELGYDLMYLLRGAPVVYYGDEVGMIGSGGDKQARQDMFPTRVDEWKTQDRVGSPPIGNGSSLEITDHTIERRLKQLAALRDANPALATGATIVRQSGGGVLVVSRIDAAARREYVAGFNSGPSPAHVSIQTSTPQCAWTLLIGSGTITSGEDGSLSFDIPATGTVLLQAGAETFLGTPPKPNLKVARDGASGLWRVGATLVGTEPVSVSFALWRKRTGWALLAADDSPPYRGFVARGRFRKKERVYTVAIARSLDGSTAISSVKGFVPHKR